jgi:hypothetical protein
MCAEQSWRMPANRSASCMSHPDGFCPTSPLHRAECTTGEFDLLFIPCDYPNGVACHCVGNPVRAEGIQGEWECYGPPRNGACPEIMPNIGEGCARIGQFCGYGLVEQGCYASYASVLCDQGAWEEVEAACAL